MFRYIFILAALFFSSNLKAEETVTLVAGNSFPPLMWEENGVAKGVAVEIGKAILETAGYKVVIKTCPWMRCQAIAEKENAFGIAYSAKLAGYSLSDFTILPVIIDRDPNYLATGKRSPGVEEKILKINAAIKALSKDGTIAKIKKTTF